MSESNESGSGAQLNKKKRPKAKAAFAPEQTGAEIGLAQLPAGSLGIQAAAGDDPVQRTLQWGADGIFGNGSFENQTTRLGDVRLQTVQRQTLAVEIGRVQGNRHLQKVIAAAKGGEKTVPYQSNISKSSTSPIGVTVMKKSANGTRPSIAKKIDTPTHVGEEILEEGLGSSGPPTMSAGEPPPDTNKVGQVNKFIRHPSQLNQASSIQRAIGFGFADKMLKVYISVLERLPLTSLGPLQRLFTAGAISFIKRLAKEGIRKLLKLGLRAVKAVSSPRYLLGFLKGFITGFFVDGLAGIFILFYDLGKLAYKLAEFQINLMRNLAQRGQGGLHQLTQKLAALGKWVLNNGKSLWEGFKAKAGSGGGIVGVVSNVVSTLLNKAEGLAKKAGEAIADSLIKFFSKAEGEIGEGIGKVTGRVAGMISFELVLSALTAGGGAALTTAKTALRPILALLSKARTGIAFIVRSLGSWLKKGYQAVKGWIVAIKQTQLFKTLGTKLDDLFDTLRKLVQRVLSKGGGKKASGTTGGGGKAPSGTTGVPPTGTATTTPSGKVPTTTGTTPSTSSAHIRVPKTPNTMDLAAQEALGGHSIARHGPQVKLSELRDRTLGTHPTMPQSRTAMKFTNAETHTEAVNQAYRHYQSEIQAHFASGGGYREWTFDFGAPTGVGFTNIGTRKNPIIQAVPAGATTKVTICFKPHPTAPQGFRLESAFPTYP